MISATRKTFVPDTQTTVPLKCIVDHGDIKHRELDKEHVATLKASITRHGLDQPLIVWNGGGDKGKQMEINGNMYPASFLIAGAHRRAAIRSIWKDDQDKYKELFPNGVPVIVKGGELTDALATHLRENLQRSDMTLEQVLPVAQRMREEGMKNKDIAKAVGKSDAWVSTVFAIEEEMGEEAVEDMKKGGVKLSHARQAVADIKKAKKAGKAVDVKATVQKLKEKAASRKAAGRQREAKRVTAKTLHRRYLALPSMKVGARVEILEAVLGYLAGDEEYDLPEELAEDPVGEEKKGKKAEAEDEGEE